MKDKYNFLDDVSWLIFHSEECLHADCPLSDKCHNDNDIPCRNVAKVRDELIKKYKLED
jgi:hypothetical protein